MQKKSLRGGWLPWIFDGRREINCLKHQCGPKIYENNKHRGLAEFPPWSSSSCRTSARDLQVLPNAVVSSQSNLQQYRPVFIFVI
jgi:hypothetical protein